jgi:hypothetical protein
MCALVVNHSIVWPLLLQVNADLRSVGLEVRYGSMLETNSERRVLPKSRNVSEDVPSAEYQASAGFRGAYPEIRLDDDDIDGHECS